MILLNQQKYKPKENNMFKAMLATKGDKTKLFTDEKETYLSSPKLDGVRCIIHANLGPVSRTLKPIPNDYIRNLLNDERLHGLDGELIVGETFSDCQSGVMTHSGEPDFKFMVFDHVGEDPFEDRLEIADTRVVAANLDFVEMVPHREVTTQAMLDGDIQEDLQGGYEGTMLRLASGPYKNGRSTANQRYLLKFKPVADCEVEVVVIVPLIDKYGTVKETMGSLVVKAINGVFKGETFSVGTGFTAKQRKDIFDAPPLGRIATIEYQAEGSKDAPRFPAFKGFRNINDMGE